jgi:hypothetical protein
MYFFASLHGPVPGPSVVSQSKVFIQVTVTSFASLDLNGPDLHSLIDQKLPC